MLTRRRRSHTSIRAIVGWFAISGTLVLLPPSLAVAQEKPASAAPATKPVLSAEEKARKLKERDQHRPGPNPVKMPDAGKITEAPARSSPAWWAAFVLSGDFR
jgi:hypothetical protein